MIDVPERLEEDPLKSEPTIYDKALREARYSLLWRLAWAGALDSAVYYDECGEPQYQILSLSTAGPDPMVKYVDQHDRSGGVELADFCRMIESYVGLPDTKYYGSDAIVELALTWVGKQRPKAA
jgi:hypothetical protein